MDIVTGRLPLLVHTVVCNGLQGSPVVGREPEVPVLLETTDGVLKSNI